MPSGSGLEQVLGHKVRRVVERKPPPENAGSSTVEAQADALSAWGHDAAMRVTVHVLHELAHGMLSGESWQRTPLVHPAWRDVSVSGRGHDHHRSFADGEELTSMEKGALRRVESPVARWRDRRLRPSRCPREKGGLWTC
jgi:hypothetical protein